MFRRGDDTNLAMENVTKYVSKAESGGDGVHGIHDKCVQPHFTIREYHNYYSINVLLLSGRHKV